MLHAFQLEALVGATHRQILFKEVRQAQVLDSSSLAAHGCDILLSCRSNRKLTGAETSLYGLKSIDFPGVYNDMPRHRRR